MPDMNGQRNTAHGIGISATDLSINIPIYDPAHRSLRHVLMLNPIAKAIRGAKYVGGTIVASESGIVVVRAVSNMSFKIGPGERVGLMGHNGAGKTTLLRTICGIYEPTGGSIEVAGRIMPLFNLMEGMLPDATGREFIRIRGILLGLHPHEIDGLAEEVIDFCELGGYIDMPVRTYSTGMLVRLAFALATSATSDILLFDELIGAGDARFIQKAEDRLRRFVDRSSIVVVASHSAAVLGQWCSRAFLLEHGQLMHDGTVAETAKIYEQRRAAQGL
jgi:ABC-2 type transport system ATP-binding protein/lipopolysaccharide transport system ATP-binding protein